MKKHILIIAILVTAIICAMAVLMSGNVWAKNTPEFHIIIKAQDADTEIELKVDDRKSKTRVLDEGVTFIQTHTKAEKPKVRILAYGDAIYPKVKEVKGEYYAFAEVKPPKDGDSYE